MAFYFNENIPENIYYNENEVLIVKYNDTVVWQKQSPSHDYSEDYFTTVARSNGAIGFKGGSYEKRYWDEELQDEVSVNVDAHIYYSTDSGQTWSSSTNPSVNVSSGDVVMWKCDVETNWVDYEGYADNYNGDSALVPLIADNNVTTANYDVQGNIMSLIYGNNFSGQTNLQPTFEVYAGYDEDDGEGEMVPVMTEATFSFAFRHMFGDLEGSDGNNHLISAENLVLPTTAMTSYCYWGMFQGCLSLTQAPSVLPATTLAEFCYMEMFQGCSSLTQAPVLPATTLEEECYSCMFADCETLETAPDLPATTLVSGCYGMMLYNCYQLNYIKMLATDISAYNCLYNWVENAGGYTDWDEDLQEDVWVPNDGATFVKAASMTTLPSGVSGIPDGWTVQNA